MKMKKSAERYGFCIFFAVILLTSTVTLSIPFTPALAQTPPEFDTYTLNPENDSFLADGNGNVNEGANDILILKGKQRPVIAFNQTEIEEASAGRTIVNATVRLFIQGNSGNWGSNGDVVNAHKILDQWVQGNSSKTGLSINGNGPGVTWKCAIDTEISNTQTDCITQWDGGNFDGIASDVITLTSADDGIFVEWNVTSDVQEFLDETLENNGWIIRKNNDDQSGKAEFSSMESATNKPELVLVFEHVNPDIITKVFEVRDEYSEIVSLDKVADEALVVDVVTNDANLLHAKVTSQITDPTIKQNLLTILDDSILKLGESANLILIPDEAGTHLKLGEILQLFNDFKTEVQNQSGSGIPQAIADDLILDIDQLIVNVQLRDDQAFAISGGGVALTTFNQLADKTKIQQTQMNLILNELESLGVTLEVQTELTVVNESQSVASSSESQETTIILESQGTTTILESQNNLNVPPGSLVQPIQKLFGKVPGPTNPALEVVFGIAKLVSSFDCGIATRDGIVQDMENIGATLLPSEKDDLLVINTWLCAQTINTQLFVDDYTIEQLRSINHSRLMYEGEAGIARAIAASFNAPDIRNQYWPECTVYTSPLRPNGLNTITFVLDNIAPDVDGTVFLDAVNDGGLFNPLEDSGIAGVDVTVTNVFRPSLTSTVQTSIDGDYLFSKVASATYSIQQTVPLFHTQSVPDPLGTNGGVYLKQTLTASDSPVTNIDFGNLPPTPLPPGGVAHVATHLAQGTNEWYSGVKRIVEFGNQIFAFYYDGSNIVYKNSTDNGVNWGNVQSVGTGILDSDIGRWTIAKDNSNHVLVAYPAIDGDFSRIKTIRGTVTDGTIAFDAPRNMLSGSPRGVNLASAGTDANGNVHVAAQWDEGRVTALYTYIYTNNLLSRSQTSSSLNTSGSFPTAIAFTSLDSGKMLWVQGKSSNNDLFYRVYDSGSWSGQQTIPNVFDCSSCAKQLSVDSNSTNFASAAFLSNGNSGDIMIANWDNNGGLIGVETAENTLSHSLPSLTIDDNSVTRIYSISNNIIYETINDGNWQAPTTPFGTTFDNVTHLTSAIDLPAALWREGSSLPFSVIFGNSTG